MQMPEKEFKKEKDKKENKEWLQYKFSDKV